MVFSQVWLMSVNNMKGGADSALTLLLFIINEMFPL